MIYQDFENIDVDNSLGVSPVGEDTRLIAREAAKLSAKNILEVGAGTGFIVIFLAKKGKQCQAVDKNPLAVELTKKNAEKNTVNIQVTLSDLFSHVPGDFNLIIFNPPFGNTSSARATKYLEIIKSIIPKENPFFARLSFLLIKSQRRKLIERFLSEAISHLRADGSIIILLDRSERDLIRNFQATELGAHKNMTLFNLRNC